MCPVNTGVKEGQYECIALRYSPVLAAREIREKQVKKGSVG